jgi:cellulose synthase/poly-beta-1,6-N-acetylglucosamine synthase-like glycosyltransferase
MTFTFLIYIGLGAGLLGLALRTAERRRTAPALPAILPACPVERGTVSVLLPVRNEEDNVAECLNGLLAQTAAPRVRVIDDGSTDTTAALVAQRAAAEPRLALLSAGPLAEGWPGKLHALWVGSRPPHTVDTPWLLLTDADTRHHPELLARAMAAAAEHRLDAVSVAGRQEARGLGENLLIPTVFAFLDTLLGDWPAAAGGAGPAVANGQFILVRWKLWQEAGGFATLREEPIDDVPMARRLRAHGGRTGFFRAPDLLQIRMYRGWTEAVRGWRRNLGALFAATPATALAAFAVLLLPPAALLAALFTAHWVEAALLWNAGAAASILLRSGSGNGTGWGLLYPLDALALAAVLALGIRDRRHGGVVRWKGREIKAG